MPSTEENAYLKFKVNKLYKQNAELETRCKKLEEIIQSHNEKFQLLESSLSEIYKNVPPPTLYLPFTQDAPYANLKVLNPTLDKECHTGKIDLFETEFKEMINRIDDVHKNLTKLQDNFNESTEKIKTVETSVKVCQKKIAELDIKEPIISLPQIDNNIEKDKNKLKENIITYCQFPQNESEKITITSKDYACLDSSEFLNDVIIDFYLKYRQKSNQIIETKAHIFSTFFYERLSFHLSRDTNADGYDRVKKWTKKVNIFEKEFIVVPVNEKLHWYLCIICYASKESNGVDSDSKKPCILVFDSFPAADKKTFRSLQ